LASCSWLASSCPASRLTEDEADERCLPPAHQIIQGEIVTAYQPAHQVKIVGSVVLRKKAALAQHGDQAPFPCSWLGNIVLFPPKRWPARAADGA